MVTNSYSYTGYGVATGGGASPAFNPFGFGGQFGYYTDFGGGILCGAR